MTQQPTREVVAIIERIREDLPGFIAASLVHLQTGMSLSGHSVRDDFDLAGASALHSELVKQKKRTLRALGSESQLEDIVMTLSDQYHFIRMVDAGSAFIYLVADRRSTNIAMASAALTRHLAGSAD